MKVFLLLTFASSAVEKTDESNEVMKKMSGIFKNPVFYIILGAFVTLIILVYLLKRFVRANPGSVVVIVRKGKIRKILAETDNVYYRVPFVDSIGAVMPLGEMKLTSDKLYVNNGPDRLYKFNYTLGYKLNNPEMYYNHLNNVQEIIENRINDSLRLFADSGNAQMLINDYRSSGNIILKNINDVINDLGIEAINFNVNFIEPMGK